MTTPESQARVSRKQTVVNWGLALSTIIGALLIEAYSFMRVMGTAGCSDRACANTGPGNFLYGLITYGAPVVALAAIVISSFTARRPRGWAVPAIAWVLLVIGFLILAVTFGG
ncbi:MAG TPA: hypothetical protein VGP27_09290 [Mycobacterium sp.]|jgi:hypothetical protein|nr:hypothetical protein [Mycobacterium sp.]